MKELFRGVRRGIFSHWRAILVLLIIVALPFLLVEVVFDAVSSHSRVCTVCHYMKPFYDQWQTSTHNQVPCIKCHPNKFGFILIAATKHLTGTYNPRPHAKVADAGCLQSGCHPERLAKPQVLFKGSISFNHNDHLGHLTRGKLLRCTSCHSQITQGEHMSVVQDVCFLCHFKGAPTGQAITGCPSCHGTPTKVVEHDGFFFSHESYLKIGVACAQCHVKVASGTGDVPPERCHECHVEREFPKAGSEFIHAKHVTENGIDCLNCHEKISHGQVEMVKSLEISCEKCHAMHHTLQKEMYMGASGRGVSDTPSRMFAAQVSCDGCHIKPSPAKTQGVASPKEVDYLAMRESCEICHGPGYDDMLDDWKRLMNAGIAELEPQVEAARKLVANAQAKGQEVSESRELMADAEFNFDFVKSSHGVHNVEYAVKLMKAIADQTEMVANSLGEKWDHKRSRLLGTPDGYCTELCHARIGLPQQVVFDEMNVDFPHNVHVSDLGIECTKCHSPEKHKMRVISKEGCLQCHHEAAKLECNVCHQYQVALLKGSLKEISAEDQSPSSMADLGCDGCHDLSKPEPVEVLRQKCVDCHEEKYGETLVQWENTLADRVSKLTLRAAEAADGIRKAKARGSDMVQAEEALREANLRREIVEKGNGVHNYELATKLLEAAEEKLRTVSESLK